MVPGRQGNQIWPWKKASLNLSTGVQRNLPLMVGELEPRFPPRIWGTMGYLYTQQVGSRSQHTVPGRSGRLTEASREGILGSKF